MTDRPPVSGEPSTDYDRRALTEDQRYLAKDIASSMPDRHDETCGVWSAAGDGCDCPLVMAVSDGLHASRVVSIEVERGWDSTTHRGDHVVRLPFRPMPAEARAIPPALDVERLAEFEKRLMTVLQHGHDLEKPGLRTALWIVSEVWPEYARLTSKEER